MSKPKILLVDDEFNILTLLEVMFNDLEYDVITAENGEIAVEKARLHKPDIIITDVVMPKKNGFEVCRDIRKIQEIADTPIILLSALGDEYNKITGFEEGADDYLTKPFSIDEVKTRAELLLQRHQNKHVDVVGDDGDAEAVKKPSLIDTGLLELNKQLNGGLPNGSNILLLGPLGIGKSSFCRQFMTAGLLKQDPSLWVAIDDDPKRIRQSLTQDLKKPITTFEEDDLIRFVDAYSWSSITPTQDELYQVNGILELNQLSGVISDASYDIGHTVQQKKGGRRVIDSISSLLINFELPQVQRFLSQISRTAVAFGYVTTIFVMEEGTVSNQVLNNIKYLMDGVIECRQDDDGGRSMRVASMKWTSYKNDWFKAESALAKA